MYKPWHYYDSYYTIISLLLHVSLHTTKCHSKIKNSIMSFQKMGSVKYQIKILFKRCEFINSDN